MATPAFTPTDHQWMSYALHLARQGLGHVRTNPMVGAVVAHGDQLIASGYHPGYGQLHAERIALMSVAESDEHLLPQATLYVTLEPCNHHGKTPPCTDIILEKGIKKVIVCQLDPNPQMSGKSIEMLRSKGIEVEVGLLEDQGKELTKAFVKNQKTGMPYTILKYARSADGYIGHPDKQVWLSNPQSKIMSHKWRTEIDAIMIGSETAIVDDPSLTAREYPGNSPLRVVIDRRGRLEGTDLSILTDGHPTVIYTTRTPDTPHNDTVDYRTLDESDGLPEILSDLYAHYKVGTLLVEGGRSLLQSFINDDLWDEGRIIHTPTFLDDGVKAHSIKGLLRQSYSLDTDRIDIIERQ